MAEEKPPKNDKVNENKKEVLQPQWMGDSYVIDAAKFGIEHVKIELKANYGFKDDTVQNALELSRAARKVMTAHASSGRYIAKMRPLCPSYKLLT